MTRRSCLSAVIIILVVLTGLSGATWFLVQPQPQYIQGEAEATKVNVAAKIPGRVEELCADEGATVQKGDLLAILDSPQLQAKREQAVAARNAASAVHKKAERGAREEQVRMAYNQWMQAKAGAEFAQKSFARIQRLFEDGVVPAQRRDEVEAQAEMAQKLDATAQAQYEMATRGAREEDKEAAAAQVAGAAGAVSEVESMLEEARLHAPIGGEVLEHIVNVGELASAGMPIVTIVDLTDVWVTFNMREDDLAGLKMGDRLHGSVPALNGTPVDLEVTYIAALGDFATWRATSASGGFDLRTFEVRAGPEAPISGLRPGMSVIVPWGGPSEDPVRAWLRTWLPWDF